MIKTLEYDNPNTNYNQVAKDRYNYITKTHPNKACSFYDSAYWDQYYNASWLFKELYDSYCITNDYGKNKVYSKLYGRKWKTRTTAENRIKWKKRLKLYKTQIKEYNKFMGNLNYMGWRFYRKNKHILYLQSYHSY